MKNILIVYAHHEPASFNHALKRTAENILKAHGCQIKVSDLYAMKFKATADWQDFKKIDFDLSKQYSVVQASAYPLHQFADDINEEIEKIKWCDVLIFQFPLWWFSAPAILKGWCDRVFAAGFSYDKTHTFKNGLLAPRQALLSVTTQSPAAAYQSNGKHGDIEQFLHPLHHTLRFSGITPLAPFVAYGVIDANDEMRKKYLLNWQEHVLRELKIVDEDRRVSY